VGGDLDERSGAIIFQQVQTAKGKKSIASLELQSKVFRGARVEKFSILVILLSPKRRGETYRWLPENLSLNLSQTLVAPNGKTYKVGEGLYQ